MLGGTAPGAGCVPEHSQAVGWAHREAGRVSSSSQKTSARTWDLVLLWIPLTGSSPLHLLHVSRALGRGAVMGKGLELHQGHRDKGSKGRVCPSLQSSVPAGLIALLEPQIRAQIVPPSVQATPPLYLQHCLLTLDCSQGSSIPVPGQLSPRGRSGCLAAAALCPAGME